MPPSDAFAVDRLPSAVQSELRNPHLCYLAAICQPQPAPVVHAPPTSHVQLPVLGSTVVLGLLAAAPLLGTVSASQLRFLLVLLSARSPDSRSSAGPCVARSMSDAPLPAALSLAVRSNHRLYRFSARRI